MDQLSFLEDPYRVQPVQIRARGLDLESDEDEKDRRKVALPTNETLFNRNDLLLRTFVSPESDDLNNVSVDIVQIEDGEQQEGQEVPQENIIEVDTSETRVRQGSNEESVSVATEEPIEERRDTYQTDDKKIHPQADFLSQVVVKMEKNIYSLHPLFLLLYILCVCFGGVFVADQENTVMLSLLCFCFVFLGILGSLLDGAPTVTWLGIGGTGITLVFVLEAVLDVSLVFLFENGDIELKEDETEVRQGLLAGALVCAFLAICVFMCKLFVIWGKLLGVIWGLEYAEKDKKQQLLGVIWGLQYDAEKDKNQQLHGLKKILFRFSNPVGIALSDTADVLLLVQIVIPPKIIVQPKIFIISIFLILNVVLSEFQTLIGTVKQLIDETLREGETLEERNDNLKRTENIRNIMRLKARVQTLLVGNLIIPIVLALSLRKNFSVSESLLVCLPILGFGFAVLNIVTERYFQWRLFASTLNEASRDILVRSLTVIWAIILGVTNIIDSLNRNRRLFIFLFYAVYSLVPLILRIIQEWKTKNVAIMYDRPLGVNVKEKDTKTNMLFRNPIADSLVYYVNQNVHPDIIVNKVIKNALITKGASGWHLIRKDVAFSTYTLCEARLGKLRGKTKSRMLNVVAMAICGVYCEDYGTESFHETLTRILAENYKIDMPGIHSLSLGKCELTVENVLKHLCLGNILAHKNCPVAFL